MTSAAVSPAALRRWAAELGTAWDQARAATATIEIRLSVARAPIRLLFAGPALVPAIAPPFAPFRADTQTEAALTVCILDGASMPAGSLPAPPWPEGFFHHDARTGEGGERLVIAFLPDSRSASLVDVARKRAILWVADAREFPPSATGSPLMVILHAWMQGRGYQLVHAAAVGTAAGGILLAGSSGSGKSTSAFACLELGEELRYAGDDYCLLGLEPEPHVHAVYGTGRLTRAMARRFPRLPLDAAADIGRGKLQFQVDRIRPGRLIDSFPVRAVASVRTHGGVDTFLEPSTPIAALRALAPSTILQLPGAGDGALRHLSALVRSVPAYVLHAGTDLAQIPRRIAALLARGR